MNKPNHFYPNGVNRPKHFYREIHETRSNDRSSIIYAATTSPSSSHYFSTPPIYGNHQSQLMPQPESGICDGMNNCHLADSWVNHVNQLGNFPINHLTNQTPILNSYIPAELKLHPTSLVSHFYQQAMYHKTYLERIYEHQRSIVAEGVSNPHQQLQLLRDGFAQCNEVSFEAKMNDHQKINKSETIYDNNSMSQRRHSKDNKKLSDDEMNDVKMSILYQDRNKKLDFKTNFRDENRKINGCFYDSENDLSPKMRSEIALSSAEPPPKKKWIKNYMTTFPGT